jgi:predicted dehydrogenase
MTTHRGVLIGCGFFARNHMHGWAQAPDARIVAVCDLDRGKAEAFAREFGVPAVHTDAAAMLAAEAPDFVDVATTVASHRPLVTLAAGHARLVICQKPFAETLADARAMVSRCEEAGTALLVHENFRWQRPFRALKEALPAIGRPHFLRLSFRHGFDVYANQPYLAEIADLALTDVGLHLFDLARFLIGDVASVHCRAQRLNPRVTGEDAFLASLEHVCGAVSSVECSFFTTRSPEPFPETLALVEGDAGTLELVQGYRLRLHTRAGVEERHVGERDVEPPTPRWGEKPWHAVQDSVAALEAHAIDVLEGRAAPQPSGAHNLETLAVTFAAIRSARTGRAIDVAEILREA